MPKPSKQFKVICVDDHAFIFESRDELLAARKRRTAGREARGDRLSISLTVGKTYVVRRECLGMYAIRDDTNGVYLFPKSMCRRVRAKRPGRRADRAV